jgi:hypothetical protein
MNVGPKRGPAAAPGHLPPRVCRPMGDLNQSGLTVSDLEREWKNGVGLVPSSFGVPAGHDLGLTFVRQCLARVRALDALDGTQARFTALSRNLRRSESHGTWGPCRAI